MFPSYRNQSVDGNIGRQRLNSTLPLAIYMIALITSERFYKSDWVEYHRKNCFMIKDSKPNTLLIGDYIVAGLNRYLNV